MRISCELFMMEITSYHRELQVGGMQHKELERMGFGGQVESASRRDGEDTSLPNQAYDSMR